MSAAGATAPEFQILNESCTSQWANFIDDLNLISTDPVQFEWVDWHATFDAERALAHDARALVQRLNLLLAAAQLSPTNEQRIVEILELGNSRELETHPPVVAGKRQLAHLDLSLGLCSGHRAHSALTS